MHQNELNYFRSNKIKNWSRNFREKIILPFRKMQRSSTKMNEATGSFENGPSVIIDLTKFHEIYSERN